METFLNGFMEISSFDLCIVEISLFMFCKNEGVTPGPSAKRPGPRASKKVPKMGALQVFLIVGLSKDHF